MATHRICVSGRWICAPFQGPCYGVSAVTDGASSSNVHWREIDRNGQGRRVIRKTGSCGRVRQEILDVHPGLQENSLVEFQQIFCQPRLNILEFANIMPANSSVVP
jgi:hypothetical protein